MAAFKSLNNQDSSTWRDFFKEQIKVTRSTFKEQHYLCHQCRTHSKAQQTPQKVTRISATFHRLPLCTVCSLNALQLTWTKWSWTKKRKEKPSNKKNNFKKSPDLRRPAPAAAIRLRINNLSTFTLLLEARLHSIHTLMDCQAAAAAATAGERHAAWAAAFFANRRGK